MYFRNWLGDWGVVLSIGGGGYESLRGDGLIPSVKVSTEWRISVRAYIFWDEDMFK